MPTYNSLSRALRTGVTSFALLLLLIVPLAGAQGATGEKVLRMALHLDFHTFGPPFYFATPDWPNLQNTYNNLVRLIPGGVDIEPDLAERWEVSDDGLVYTFHLRQGVQFHRDYGEMTSDDVVFSLTNSMTTNLGTARSANLRHIETLEALDDYTVRITLSAPYPDFLETAIADRIGLIYSRTAFEELGVDGYANRPVGTGAYWLSEWRRAEGSVFLAHDEFFRGRPAIDRVVVSVIPEETVIALAMMSGEIDFTFIRTPDAISMAQAAPNLQVEATPVLAIRSLWMNLDRPQFQDERVRKALSHAIDREAIARDVMNGNVSLDGIWSVLPPGIVGSTGDVVAYGYDPELARQLLADAGYADGIDFTVNVRFGDMPVLEAVQAMWAEVGARARILEVDGAQDVASIASGEWDMSISGPSLTSPDAFLLSFHSDSGHFYGRIDDLIDEQRSEVDPERRAELLREIQQDINAFLPGFPLYRPLYVTVARDGVTGDVPNTHYWLWYWELMDIQQ